MNSQEFESWAEAETGRRVKVIWNHLGSGDFYTVFMAVYPQGFIQSTVSVGELERDPKDIRARVLVPLEAACKNHDKGELPKPGTPAPIRMLK